MREVPIYSPPRRAPAESAVRRVQFDDSGGQLVAWVGPDAVTLSGPEGRTADMCVHDLAAGRSRPLNAAVTADYWGAAGTWPAVSSDLRFAASEFRGDGDGVVSVMDLTQTGDPEGYLPTGDIGSAGLAFTPDGTFLLASYHLETRAGVAATVVRFPLKVLTAPPARYRATVNPFTGQTMETPERNVRWETVLTIPVEDQASALGVSADGRRAALGTRDGEVRVVDLKTKRLSASFQWAGREVYHDAVRVGFDPAGKWVVLLAAGRLFARPLGKTGAEWATNAALGYLRDFAFHPDGGILAVVDEDGRAHDLDPRTGAVVRTFKWKRGPLYSVAFAPDGLTCAAGAGGGRVLVWDVDA